MNRPLIYLIILIFVFPFSEVMSQEAAKTGRLKISSSVFENNKSIPQKYTCDGANGNPPLKVENVPREAKSLALILDDKDAPRGTYVHWILWGLRPGLQEIRENSVPEGAVQGRNDFQKNNYGGPCPPSRAHRYVFKVYALDVQLNLDPKSMKADLEKAMEGHVIARGELMGVYKRK
jgi:hypothetical protein